MDLLVAANFLLHMNKLSMGLMNENNNRLIFILQIEIISNISITYLNIVKIAEERDKMNK